MTQFSFEVPIDNMSDFEDLQDFHFTLSFLYKDKRYRDYFFKEREKGLKTIWLDNSYNEKMRADKPDQLIALAKQLGPDKVISPDSPMWDSLQIFDNYFLMAKQFPHGKVIVVVKDEVMYRMALRFEITTIATPYRIRMNMKLEDYEWSVNCHYLGLACMEELAIHKPPSCDTSMPIKLAIEGKTMKDWYNAGQPHIHTKDRKTFFTTKLTSAQVKLARTNIKTLKGAIQ